MSRLPLKVKPQDMPQPPEFVLMLDTMSEGPITCSEIRTWTRQDPLLSTVLRHTQMGWPLHCPEEELKPYWSRRNELASIDVCVLWGFGIVIPNVGQTRLVTELHNGHPGISRMKALARTVMWWPGIDHDIETTVNKCSECQVVRPAPPAVPLQPWHGLLGHGPAFTWTLPDHFSTTCF